MHEARRNLLPGVLYRIRRYRAVPENIEAWEYDDEAAYQRIQAAVAADPDSAHAQEVRKSIGTLFTEMHESFARSTVRI